MATNLQRGKICNLDFVRINGVQRAVGVCVEHPKHPSGHYMLTSEVVCVKRRSFTTLNTRYEVVGG
jgi:hypothetical protein